MVDPDRKINLDLTSEEEDSDEPELDPTEVTLVKEFEEEFKDRFTDDDKTFADFCKQKPKPPPIVFPFGDGFHHRGGYRGGNRGGRFQNYGGHRQNFDNHRNNYDQGSRYHQNTNHFNNRNRDYQQQPPHKKRREEDSNQSGGV